MTRFANKKDKNNDYSKSNFIHYINLSKSLSLVLVVLEMAQLGMTVFAL
jgi:hypothetical protein